MPVTIRSAVSGDLSAILAVEQQEPNAAHWIESQYQTRLAGGVLLVAEENLTILGFVCARTIAGEWELENIMVADRARRRGVADQLLADLLRRAQSRAGTAVWLEVRESNQPARRLYEKAGFFQSGRRREYYKNPVEDALTYTLHTWLKWNTCGS